MVFSALRDYGCGQVYTPWENLKKRDDMDVGQIGYKNMKAVCEWAGMQQRGRGLLPSCASARPPVAQLVE